MIKYLFYPLLTLTVSVAYIFPLHAQYAFSDAVELQSFVATSSGGKVTLSNNPAVLMRLSQYVPKGDTGAMLLADFENNPFIAIAAARSSFLYVPPAGAASPLANLDVTNLANGLASLLIERAKQELTIAFFNHFKDLVGKYPAFGILFPTTTANLEKLLSYAYPQMLPVLRNGFFSDLRALPANLPGLLSVPQYQPLFAKRPELAIALRSMQLIGEVRSGASSPPEIIQELAGFQEWRQPGASMLLKNIGAYAKAAAWFSTSLQDPESNQFWVTPQALKSLASENVADLYLGLLWQRAKSDTLVFYTAGGKVDSLTTLLTKAQNKLQLLQSRVPAFVTLVSQLRAAWTLIDANTRSGKPNTDNDYYQFIGTAVDAVDSAFGIVNVFEPGLDAKPYIDLARTGNDLFKDIYAHQYTQMVSDVLDALSGLGTLAGDGGKNPDDIQKLAAFAEKIKPYALFMANLLEATSAGDVQAALENAILPVGSSSIKKNTKLNFAVQAYLGAYFAVGPSPSGVTGVWSDRVGVTAPIGLSLTPGFASLGKGGSFSLFGSVFDLGAIVDYQLRTDSTTNSAGTPTTTLTKSYSVKLGQIFSPGAYIVYGLGGNLPLAAGVGFQYGPGLSKINAGGGVTVANPTVRWNLFLTVDLPLFNLVNVSK